MLQSRDGITDTGPDLRALQYKATIERGFSIPDTAHCARLLPNQGLVDVRGAGGARALRAINVLIL